MIYRIGIWVKGASGPDYKFSHYATPDELRYLRVSAGGAVERIRPDGTWELMMGTHTVEHGAYALWGNHITLHVTEVYENDYVADTPEEPVSNAQLMHHIGQILELNMTRCYVVGNTHNAHYPNIHREIKS
jgi:hypothetical protein